MRFYFFGISAFGCSTYLLVYHLATFDKKYARDVGNTIFYRKVWVFVYVYFTYVYAAIVLGA